MLILHGSLGLGDAVYMWPVVKYYTALRNDVCIITRYPELYATLNCQTIKPEDILDCQLSARTKEPETNMFEDALIMSGIKSRLPLEIKYGGMPRKYSTNKLICIVRTPSYPVKGDESAACMVPNIEVYQKIINAFKNKVCFVSVGLIIKTEKKLETEIDLSGITDLREYFSAIDGANIVISQPGHCVPIAEAFKKPLLVIFAAKGLKSEEKRYKFTTPKKILINKKSCWIVDNEPIDKILETFDKIIEDAYNVSDWA